MRKDQKFSALLLAASLALLLTACGGSSSSSEEEDVDLDDLEIEWEDEEETDETYTDESEETEETDESGEEDEDDEDAAYTDISEEDLADYTEACTAYEHLAIDGTEVSDFSESFLSDEGIDTYDSVISYDGYVYSDGTTGYEYNYTILLDDEYNEMISVSYDAVTSEVHLIALWIQDEETAASYISDFAETYYDDEEIADADIDALFAGEDDTDTYTLECGEVYVYVYYDTDNAAYNIVID